LHFMRRNARALDRSLGRRDAQVGRTEIAQRAAIFSDGRPDGTQYKNLVHGG